MLRWGKFAGCVFAALMCAGTAGSAFAQSYPARTVRLLLPFPPGGPSDLLGRPLAQKLAEQMGVPVVVDNRPGAGGNIGLELAARAPPDGYTLVLGAPPLAISPGLYAKLNYDPQQDLAPGGTPSAIVTRLNGEIHKALGAPDIRQKLSVAGIEPKLSTPEQFASFIRAETVRYAKVIREAGIKLE